jgi:hypothetical protein
LINKRGRIGNRVEREDAGMPTVGERITESSDKERWDAYKVQWEVEHRPSWLVVGGSTYKGLRLVGDELVFEYKQAEGLYDTTSFG